MVRNWCSIDYESGSVKYGDSITRTNEYIANGFDAILTVTIDEKKHRVGKTRAASFLPCVEQLKALDRRCIIQLGNEVNMDNYWPGGDVVDAVKNFAVPLARQLKALGFKVALPSLTWQDGGQLTAWFNLMKPHIPVGLFDYVNGHNYPYGVSNMEDILKVYKGFANQLGCKLMCTEWGKNPAMSLSVFNSLLPQFRALMRKYTDINVYFIASFGPKFTDDFPWLWDLAGNRKSATFAIFVASKQ